MLRPEVQAAGADSVLRDVLEGVPGLEGGRGDPAQGPVPAAGVVERLEVVEDDELGLTAGREPAVRLLVEQLALQGGEHALGQRVIEAIRDAAHARQRPVPAQLPIQSVTGVLAAPVAVMDHPGDMPAAAVHGHANRVDDQVGLAVRRHRPADDQAAEDVGNACQVEPALHRRHVGDVGDPQLVRGRRDEVAVDAVGRDVGLRVLPGDRERPLAAVAADDLRRPHEPGDALAPDVDAGVGELGVRSRSAADAPVGVERRRDLLGQDLVRQLAG